MSLKKALLVPALVLSLFTGEASVSGCGEDDPDPGPAGCGCDFFDTDCPDSPVLGPCEGQPKASASASASTSVSTWSK